MEGAAFSLQPASSTSRRARDSFASDRPQQSRENGSNRVDYAGQVRALNRHLIAVGVRPLAPDLEPKSTIGCVNDLLALLQNQQSDDDVETVRCALVERLSAKTEIVLQKMRRLEAEVRSLKLERKTLRSDLKEVRAVLDSERSTRELRERNESTSGARAAAERDELSRECAQLKSREEHFKREIKRRDADNERLRDKLKKAMDSSGGGLASLATVVGEAPHTPMKQRAANSQPDVAVLQQQLSDAQALNWKLKGEKHALRTALDDLNNDMATLTSRQ